MDDKVGSLKQTADKIRFHTFEAIAKAGGGHFGGCLSIVEILTVLYFDILNIDPHNPKDVKRDRFILSKGHGGPALYTTMALKGYYSLSELDGLDQPLSKFPKHVDRLKLDGIEVSTGPLGQGLSVACGMAVSLKQQKKENNIYVLLSDGECNSGQTWEAAMMAAKYNLDNLIAIIDRNYCTIDGPSDEVMPLEPLDGKFTTFGWVALEADGHDVSDLLYTMKKAREIKGKPVVIIAKTIKGKGVSFMENRFEWHSGSISQDQYQIGIEELRKHL